MPKPIQPFELKNFRAKFGTQEFFANVTKPYFSLRLRPFEKLQPIPLRDLRALFLKGGRDLGLLTMQGVIAPVTFPNENGIATLDTMVDDFYDSTHNEDAHYFARSFTQVTVDREIHAFTNTLIESSYVLDLTNIRNVCEMALTKFVDIAKLKLLVYPPCAIYLGAHHLKGLRVRWGNDEISHAIQNVADDNAVWDFELNEGDAADIGGTVDMFINQIARFLGDDKNKRPLLYRAEED
ncbi:MAG: hypothetical protein AB1508_12735 [Pseudomonadota bacterium]